MTKILVTYATLSGTTAEVAEAIGNEISKAGPSVEIVPLSAVKDIDSYDGVVLGGPMVAGWHRSALGFARKHRKAWSRIPLAVFVTAMSLTRTATGELDGVPLHIDEALPKPPQRADRLSFRERYARVENYARPIVNAVRPAKPVSIAFFGGRLEYGRLPWWAVVFAMFIIQAPAGDKHNFPFIREWAAGLPAAFERSAPAM
ncbi:MAG TPA: flavodoxin domain-containing protein [Anaerolineales bacterium]|nr:flavodoxin domain-containing protein [Anaerolineales bacterium]